MTYNLKFAPTNIRNCFTHWFFLGCMMANTKALQSLKMPVTTCLMTKCHIPEHLNLQQHQCEHLKSHTQKPFHIISVVTFMIYFHTKFSSLAQPWFPILMLLLMTSDALPCGDKPPMHYILNSSTFKICTLTHGTKIPIFQWPMAVWLSYAH